MVRSHMIDIQPFREKHIEDAARLFVKRYRLLRKDMPLLPSRYEKTKIVSSLLAGIWGENEGAVALSSARLIGYLIAHAGIPYFKGINRGAYIPEWAHCADEDCDGERVYQSLYKETAGRWISTGCFTHAVTLFAADDDLQRMFQWLGFGFLVVDAIRETVPISDEERGGSGLVIRKATPDDSKALESLHVGLRSYLRGSPVFLHRKAEDDAVRGFLHDRVCTVAAFRGDEMVGCMRGTPIKEDGCDTVKDPSIMGVDFAYTVPHIRGSGVATAILNRVLQWGKRQKKQSCAVDFESANPLGVRFWLRNFQPVCYSALRSVDPRIVWPYPGVQ